jgi:hypothetical protein
MMRSLPLFWSGSSWEDVGNSGLRICHGSAFEVEWRGFADRGARKLVE